MTTNSTSLSDIFIERYLEVIFDYHCVYVCVSYGAFENDCHLLSGNHFRSLFERRLILIFWIVVWDLNVAFTFIYLLTTG